MNSTETREHHKQLLIDAKNGEQYAIDYLQKTFKLKVWTHQAIYALNYYNNLSKERKMSYIYHISETPLDKRFIEINDEQYKINWIDDIGENFYLMGCTYSSKGGGVYCATLDLTTGFKILFNTSYWTTQDTIERAKRIISSQTLIEGGQDETKMVDDTNQNKES